MDHSGIKLWQLMASLVLLWVLLRSCSTAAFRSISLDGGVYYEPHLSAAYYGTESVFPKGDVVDEGSTVLPAAELAYSSSVNTFSWVKETLEGEHKGARFVVA